MATYDSDTHGGLGGFLGVTHSVLTPEEDRVIYTSETGNRIMQFDIANNRQLPDLATYEEGRSGMVFCLAYTPDGRLLNTRGGALHLLDDRTGETIRTYTLEGKGGWAVVTASADNQHAYLGNFFVGKLIKLDLESGDVVASAEIGVEAGTCRYCRVQRLIRTGDRAQITAPVCDGKKRCRPINKVYCCQVIASAASAVRVRFGSLAASQTDPFACLLLANNGHQTLVQ